MIDWGKMMWLIDIILVHICLAIKDVTKKTHFESLFYYFLRTELVQTFTLQEILKRSIEQR